MYDLPATPSIGAHQPSASSHDSLVPDRISVAVDYWVIDETGELADPTLIAELPGAVAGTTPHSIAVETPPSESCGELQAHLEGRLQTAVALAHKAECRLLPLGLRPDFLADRPSITGRKEDEDNENDEDEQLTADHPPPSATASTRVTFETDPDVTVDVYNILLALDPAFALLNTTQWATTNHQYACGRAATRNRRVAPYRTDNDTDLAGGDDTNIETERWQPIRLCEAGRLEWRSLDATTPTLLVDLIADVISILQQASKCQLSVESFGNGFDVGCLSLPTKTWREIYAEQAAHNGVDSIVLRAYLERLGIETGWYLAAAPTAISPNSASELAGLYHTRAALLEADVGLPQPLSG